MLKYQLGAVPFEYYKGVMPMTANDLFQFGIFVVALIGLVYEITKNNRP